MRTIDSIKADIQKFLGLATNGRDDATVNAALDRVEALQAEMASADRGRRLAAASPSGFSSAGDFYRAVVNAAAGGRDPRLVQAAFSGEGTPADGGYAVPPDFRQGIESLIKGPESILSRCSIINAKSNAVTLPLDENAPWDAAGGILPADVAEGALIGDSKIAIKGWTATLAKVAALVYVTEEMLEDVVGIGEYVQGKTAEKLDYDLSARIVTAALASGSKLTAAKTGGAAAGSAPDLANVLAMWRALHPSFRAKAVWLANPGLEGAFQGFTVGNQPIFMPAGGAADAPLSTLYGKPVIYSEAMPAVGTEGDLTLCDPSSIYAVLRGGGPRVAMSAHVRFDSDLTAFKTTVRAAFKSKLTAPITRPDTTQASNIVTLATR